VALQRTGGTANFLDTAVTRASLISAFSSGGVPQLRPSLAVRASTHIRRKVGRSPNQVDINALVATDLRVRFLFRHRW